MKKSLIATLLSLSLLLSACGGAAAPASSAPAAGDATPTSSATADGAAAQETIRVMWWGSQTRHDQTIQMIDLFMQNTPTVTVEYEYGGFDTYWDKVTSMMAANNAPDVFQNSVAYILGHVNSGQLLELDSHIAEGTINLSDWDEVFKTLGMVDGKTYGLSLGNSAYTMLFDPAVFKEAGISEPTLDWSWEDYHAALATIKEKTGKFGDSCYPATLIEGYQMYLRQNGYDGIFNETRDGLSYDKTDLWVQFFTKQKELMDAGLIMPYDQTLDTLTSIELSGIAAGSAGILGIINSNQAVAIANAKAAPVKLTTYPHATGEKQPGNFIGPTMFFSVPKSSAAPVAAATFINYMLNDVEANKISLMEKGVPASANVRAQLEPLLTETGAEASRYVGEVAKFAVPYDNIYPVAYSEILDLYKKLVEDMMFERIEIEAAGVQFNTEVSALLKAKS